jgi:hypothetical protein
MFRHVSTTFAAVATALLIGAVAPSQAAVKVVAVQSNSEIQTPQGPIRVLMHTQMINGRPSNGTVWVHGRNQKASMFIGYASQITFTSADEATFLADGNYNNRPAQLIMRLRGNTRITATNDGLCAIGLRIVQDGVTVVSSGPQGEFDRLPLLWGYVNVLAPSP